MQTPMLIAFGLALTLLALWLRTRLLIWLRRNEFQGQVVLITGASRGIGRSLALEFARRGARLALVARSEQQLAGVEAECRALSPDLEILRFPTDLTQPAARDVLVPAVESHFGRLDVLVNNAGLITGGHFAQAEAQEIDELLALNLAAPMHLSRAALPGMRARGQGLIINMASILGRHSMPYFAVYAASKHGLIGFSDALRRELSGSAVRVMPVAAGFTATAMVRGAEATLRRYGVLILSPDWLARRVVEAALMRRAQITPVGIERFAIWMGHLWPAFADLLWRLLAPSHFAQIAKGQRTR